MKLGVVVVHYRFWPDIEATLDALWASTLRPDAVLVVDDCSPDGSAEELRRARPDVDVIVAPENRGVIANFDAGLEELRRRGMDAILMLTHETVLEPDALELLAARLDSSPSTGAVGPLLGFSSRPDTVFSAGGQLLAGTWQNPHAGMYEPLAEWRGTGLRRVPWLDGACVLVRTAAMADVGRLPTRYFHYYDDVELGVRLNQAGWRVECVTGAVARQEPGLLSEYYRVRNRLGFLHATAPRRVLLRAIGCHLRRAALDVRGTEDGRSLALAQLRGIRDFALGRWGRAPKSYLAAQRRDYATGGALEGPIVPSWSLPETPRQTPPLATARG
ncbi:MAG TPA: glycosyltransferase family 2 protein [Solirubrobacteraceae bacterium]